MGENIREALAKQKVMLTELSNQIKSIEESDVFVTNQKHLEQYEKLTARYEEAERARRILSAENAGLKAALYEQYYNEKLQLITKSQKQLEIFFASDIAGGQNRLTVIENSIKQRISHVLEALDRNRVDMDNEIYGKIAELKAEAHIKIAEAREQLAESASLIDEEKVEFESLKNESLNDEQIVKLSKKNNLERLVGLNVLNIVGIILIIIGATAAGQFAYLQMSDFWRGMSLFALGAVFLVAGEIINRKAPNIFSLGITAGGAGILYVALAISYFGLGIISMYMALIICIAITVLVFFLSTRYNAEVLLAIALIGGYLPILSIGPERALLFAMMGYFVLLNLLALSVAFRRKWTVGSFVGLILNLLGTAYISLQIGSIHPVSERIIEIIFIAFAMFIYTAIPIVSTYMTKSNFRKSDVVLLSINTFFGSLIMFLNIAASGWSDYLGLASALFAVVYLAIGYVVASKFPDEKAVSSLFYITGLTFSVLFVPFQLDYMWITLGWLVQGTSLVIYGIIQERRSFQLSGFVINGLCLLWFLLFDVSSWLSSSNNLFFWQYMAITMASILIMAAFTYKKEIYSNLQKAFKYCTTVNLWFYVLFLISRLGDTLNNVFPASNFDLGYLIAALMGVATLLLAIILSRISFLLDEGMKIIAIVLNVFGILGILFLNLSARPIIAPMSEQPISIVLIATAILIATSIISAYAVYNLTHRAVMKRIIGVQYLPLAVSAYVVVIFTINLIRTYDLSFASFWISIIYVLMALLLTVLGFIKRYALLRQFGLALALLSVTKLFLIDLATLTQGFRILSYFVLGAVLVAISFVYQHFSKRLELSMPQNQEDEI